MVAINLDAWKTPDPKSVCILYASLRRDSLAIIAESLFQVDLFSLLNLFFLSSYSLPLCSPVLIFTPGPVTRNAAADAPTNIAAGPAGDSPRFAIKFLIVLPVPVSIASVAPLSARALASMASSANDLNFLDKPVINSDMRPDLGLRNLLADPKSLSKSLLAVVYAAECWPSLTLPSC